MKKLAFLLLIAIFPSFLSVQVLPAPLPPYPSNKPSRPDVSELRRAEDLYMMLRKENRRLHWDQCLARKAFIRAKQLVVYGYFDHEDPRTGKNPAWDLVWRCFQCAYAGENLAKGMDTPENIHKALMNSPTHRKNIMNPNYDRVGVGCYDYVCVELFAGM